MMVDLLELAARNDGVNHLSIPPNIKKILLCCRVGDAANVVRWMRERWQQLYWQHCGTIDLRALMEIRYGKADDEIAFAEHTFSHGGRHVAIRCESIPQEYFDALAAEFVAKMGSVTKLNCKRILHLQS